MFTAVPARAADAQIVVLTLHVLKNDQDCVCDAITPLDHVYGNNITSGLGVHNVLAGL